MTTTPESETATDTAPGSLPRLSRAYLDLPPAAPVRLVHLGIGTSTGTPGLVHRQRLRRLRLGDCGVHRPSTRHRRAARPSGRPVHAADRLCHRARSLDPAPPGTRRSAEGPGSRGRPRGGPTWVIFRPRYRACSTLSPAASAPISPWSRRSSRRWTRSKSQGDDPPEPPERCRAGYRGGMSLPASAVVCSSESRPSAIAMSKRRWSMSPDCSDTGRSQASAEPSPG